MNVDTEAVNAYLAGEPLASIAARCSTSVSALAGQLDRAGIPRRTHVRRAHAIQRLHDGATVDAVAAESGVSPRTARVWAAATGIPCPRVGTRPRRRRTLDPAVLERYLAGESAVELADELGITVRAFNARRRRAGVLRPRPPRPTCPGCGRRTTEQVQACRECRRRYPSPEPRVCELDGCDVMFTPQAEKVSRGAGRFHSYACWNEWRRGRPQREWRK